MTKQEERQTLAKIEKLIASAGADSYIGMAFAGCVEMARDNIENDFGNSMQESLIRCRENLQTEHEMRTREQNENERLSRIIANNEVIVEDLKAKLAEEKKKQIPASLFRELRDMVAEQEKNAQQELTNASIHLAAFADHPNDIAVAHGLKQLNAAVNKRTQAYELLTRLAKYEPK